jgi:DNA repair exonuclease SbcCD nuclease subunit
MKNKYSDENGNVVSFWSTDDNVLCEDGKTLRENLDEVDAQFKDIANIGKLTDLDTTEKSSIVGAINEVFQSASNGKSLIATAITGKGVSASNTDTFEQLANKIRQIEGQGTTPTPSIFSITNNLSNCTNNNSASEIEENTSYIATITPSTNYEIINISVVMDSVDITSSVVNNNSINIESVTGDIIITATATLIEQPLYSFGVMSDIHIPSDETSDTVYGSKYQGLTKFNNVANSIQNKGLDFVCITGDLTTYSYAEQLANYKSIVDAQEIPFYACNGNHDGESDTNWNTYVGHNVNHTFEKNNDVFIFMSAINESPAIDYLKTQLETYNDKRIFLFMHYPLTGYAGLKTNEAYGFASDSTKDDEILALLKSHLNVHCFSGHTHYIFELQENYSNINVATLDYYNISLIHVPSLTQPRNINGNMTDLTVSNQYLEMYKVDVYEKKIILHAYNVATDEELYTYEISTDADYTKSNSIVTSTYNVAIDEGQSQTFTVKLENAPSENVIVNLSSESEFVTVSPSTLTFTTENYSTEQTVIVNAVDDGTTADYTTLIHLISNNIPSEDVNIAVTNTTVIDTRTKYDLSSINSAVTSPFVLPDEYPYAYVINTYPDVYCTNVRAYTSGGANLAGFIGGKGQKWKWNTSTKEWYLYKDYDATSTRQLLGGTVTHCNNDLLLATWNNGTYTPSDTVVVATNLFPL